MHKGQTVFSRLGGIDRKFDALTPEAQFRTLVRFMKARENLYECRFSRSVSPDEPVYFATANNKIGITQSGRAAEGFGEVAQLERRLSMLTREGTQRYDFGSPQSFRYSEEKSTDPYQLSSPADKSISPMFSVVNSRSGIFRSATGLVPLRTRKT